MSPTDSQRGASEPSSADQTEFVTRFADGPTTSVDCVIAASTTDIWAVISDPGFPAKHSDELYRAEWDDPSVEPGVGARIHGWNRMGDFEWESFSTITVWDPGRRLEWTVDESSPGSGTIATWWFDLEPIDDGDEPAATRLTQGARLGPGQSGLTMAIAANPDKEAKIIAGRLRQQQDAMTANLQAIRTAIEP